MMAEKKKPSRPVYAFSDNTCVMCGAQIPEGLQVCPRCRGAADEKPMSVERAMEILDCNHREHYESIAPVNEACTMGRNALAKLLPESPYDDGLQDVLACPRCGSGEYLRNEDGAPNRFCGQCGQAIKWPGPQK